MGSAGSSSSLLPNFLLTPRQQSLLFAALNSSSQQPLAPNVLNQVFQESSFLYSYHYDLGDSSYDFSSAITIDETPGLTGDLPKLDSKRSHPDDKDVSSIPGKDPMRYNSTKKVPKKPGRKALTLEPLSKRKAQNRAAQRAFRERKQRYLKDLEAKVDELEKAFGAANSENSLLRAQVGGMTSELGHHKQQVSVITDIKPLPREKALSVGSTAVNNLSDANFQFESPKSGALPDTPNNNLQKSGSLQTSPHQMASATNPSTALSNSNSPQAQFKDDLRKVSDVLSPYISSLTTSASCANMDSANFSFNGATSSSSASNHSNGNPSSSRGTSPEPFSQSFIRFKPIEAITTTIEEQLVIPSGTSVSHLFNVDLSRTHFDWLAHQNGGQFDAQPFGDYGEPEENSLSNSLFDNLFKDSLDSDFFTPY
ncbi:hypothetical protein BGZ63DRAFT_429661 [Mariannaea sp. PMI_226]|nr:hypothetical protein BGZ63DRAFT_429661 [Mariannaea sp. PMI_226]